MFANRPKPVVLMILDGFGVSSPSNANAVSLAKLPHLDNYINEYPIVTLQAAGEGVGLSWGEMGNSEVGHLSLGTGQIIYQSLPRITRSIADKSFFANEQFKFAFDHVKQNKSRLHIMGLVSDGSVHSYNEHLYALVEAAKLNEVNQVYIHVFLDGRDTAYNSGVDFIAKLQEKLKQINLGSIATISGRYYAMDRDNHWERIEKTFFAMTKGESDNNYKSAVEAVEDSYSRGIYDEEFIPTVIVDESGKSVTVVEDNDAIIFFNFRADRARQITKAFVLPGFDKFSKPRTYMPNLFFVGMTEYEKDLPIKVAFPPIEINAPLAAVISQAGLTQLHIAETEKYAHVTFFFNGGKEQEYPGEDRVLIPSPRIASYDEQPKMSAEKITEQVINAISEDKYDFIVMNYANPDMVAHTGNIKATIEALEYIDMAVSKVVDAVLEKNGLIFITADHGNAEGLFDLQTGEIDKEHSTSPVPLFIIANELKGQTLIPGVTPENLCRQVPRGILSDVGPTILKSMGLKKPDEMTGASLF